MYFKQITLTLFIIQNIITKFHNTKYAIEWQPRQCKCNDNNEYHFCDLETALVDRIACTFVSQIFAGYAAIGYASPYDYITKCNHTQWRQITQY